MSKIIQIFFQTKTNFFNKPTKNHSVIHIVNTVIQWIISTKATSRAAYSLPGHAVGATHTYNVCCRVRWYAVRSRWIAAPVTGLPRRVSQQSQLSVAPAGAFHTAAIV